jgi:CBS domain-containing protein
VTVLAAIATTRVGEIVRRAPVLVGPATPLGKVVSLMAQGRRGAVLVESEARGLEGIFTERDLMLRVSHDDTSWRLRPVGEVMTPSPVTISAATPLAQVLRRMTEGGFRHLPIVEDGRAVGIVSVRDVMRHIAESFPQEFLNLPPDPDHEARGRWGG